MLKQAQRTETRATALNEPKAMVCFARGGGDAAREAGRPREQPVRRTGAATGAVRGLATDGDDTRSVQLFVRTDRGVRAIELGAHATVADLCAAVSPLQPPFKCVQRVRRHWLRPLPSAPR